MWIFKCGNLKLKKGDLVLISVFFILIDILCLWCIDVSVACLINGGYMTNGFFMGNSMITYHIGIYGIILSSFGFLILFIHVVLKDQ